MTGPFKGSCLCRAVQFEIDQFRPQAAHCHCSMCRKFHGAAFATIASVAHSGFRWTCGVDALKEYTAPNETIRTFCRHCGSSLMFFSPRAPSDEVEIALAAFDDPVPVEPDAHIFVDSAANWTVLTDDLPKFSAGRNSPRSKRKP